MNSAVEIRDCEQESKLQFNDHGFHIVANILSGADCDAMATELSDQFERQRNRSGKKVGGVRNIFQVSPRVTELASSEQIVQLIEKLTGHCMFPVRAVFFDKNIGANWSVPWHQDLAIAVAERIETPGFGPWSVKEGIVHVQPPCEILDHMLTLRLHLDDCFADNGALKIIPGSHLHGGLSTEEINAWAESGAQMTCEISKGGVLAMRPLLLHASARATNPTHRRVLHLEFATDELPNGLKWFER